MNLPDEYYRHASQSLKSTNDVYKPVSNIKQPQENLDSMPKASQLPSDDLELVERKRSLAGENCCRSQTMKRVCTASENLKLLELYQRLGKKWKLISTEFPDKFPFLSERPSGPGFIRCCGKYSERSQLHAECFQSQSSSGK